MNFKPEMIYRSHNVFLQLLAFFICMGCAYTSSAQSDRYLHFDGVDDFAEVPNATQYFTGATGISMTGWFCSSSIGYGRGYFGFRGPGNGEGQMYVIELNAGTLECRYISTNGFHEFVAPAATAQAGVWKHVAWIFNGTASELYIDGELLGSVPSSGTFTSTTRSFGIGKSIEPGFNFVFAGRIDEVTVWSKGLTQAEIQDIMANELIGNEPNLELYYKMNQGIPAGNNTAITQLVSEVGAGTRNANLINFTLNGATSNFNVGSADPGFTLNDHCQGAANQATVTGTPGGTFSFPNLVFDGASIDPVTGSISDGVAGTTYTVQYTTNGTCPISETHDVTILSPDDPSFTLTAVCAGDPNAASNIATPGGTFSFDPDPLDGATLDPITGEITGGVQASTYSISYTTNGSCPSSLTVDVTMLPLDDPSFTLTDECFGSPMVPTAIASPGGVFSFETDPMDGASINPLTGELSGGVAGSSYDIVYTTAGQCPAASNISFTVLSSPIITGFIETCSADGTFYTVAVDLSNGDPSTYSVTGGTGTFLGSTFTSDPILSGTSYDFQFSDVNQCNFSQVLGEVLCTCLAGLQLSGDISFCENESGTITINLTGNGPWTIGYEIDGVPQAEIITASDQYNLIVTDPGQYQFTSISDADCTNNLTPPEIVEVNVFSLPSASISGDASICEGESTLMSLNFTGPGPWEFEYAIDGFPQGPIMSASSSFILDATQAGVYTILTVEDAHCPGAGMGSATLIVHALPTASISGNLIFCEGSEASLDISLSGAPGYDLTYTIDGTAQPVLSILDPSFFELLTNVTGTYELLSISDANCIGTASGTVNISMQALPSASLQDASYTICEGSAQILAIDLTGNPEWNVIYSIDGLLQAGLTSASSPLQLNAMADGVYELISVSDDLCVNTDLEGQVSISYFPPITITYSEGVEICQGDTAEVWAIATGGSGDVYSYEWQLNDIVESVGNTASYNPNSSTSVAVTINEECQYNQTFQVPITVHPLPPISISGITELCGAGTSTLFNATPNSFIGDDCLWIIESDSILNCGSIIHYFELGSYDVTLEVTSPEGCFNSLVSPDLIQVSPGSTADFTFYPQEVTTTEPLVNFFNSSLDAESHLWSFGNIAFSQEFEPVFDFGSDAGIWDVCLNTTNEFGCSDSICQTIRVKSDLLLSMPNSFTPDNDGVNDFFFPVLFGADSEDYEFFIYDRYGNTVFRTMDIHEKWNGSYMETQDYYSTDAIYTWILVTKPLGSLDKRTYTGSVLMIR